MRYRAIQRAALFLTAVILMGIFSGCGAKPVSGEPYTFTVSSDTDGTRQWQVQPDSRDVVSYAVTERQDGKTDVVFTGLKRGETQATLYRAPKGRGMYDADDVYVLSLRVDRKGNVTGQTAADSAYTVDCGRGISGSEWVVECADDGVRWTQTQKADKSDGDGMQGYSTLYTFTGRRPGASHVLVQTYLPWCSLYEPMRELWLYVDSDFHVSQLQMTDFQSMRVSEQDTSAIHHVFEAQKTDGGVRLSEYEETSRWSDEAGDYVSQRQNETAVDGDEVLYRSIAGLLHECGVTKWDGFRKSNPHILDGKMFTFEATLADGTTVQASGSNSYPDGYRALYDMLHAFLIHNA